MIKLVVIIVLMAVLAIFETFSKSKGNGQRMKDALTNSKAALIQQQEFARYLKEFRTEIETSGKQRA